MKTAVETGEREEDGRELKETANGTAKRVSSSLDMILPLHNDPFSKSYSRSPLIRGKFSASFFTRPTLIVGRSTWQASVHFLRSLNHSPKALFE
jgi:hypothetical protein